MTFDNDPKRAQETVEITIAENGYLLAYAGKLHVFTKPRQLVHQLNEILKGVQQLQRESSSEFLARRLKEMREANCAKEAKE